MKLHLDCSDHEEIFPMADHARKDRREIIDPEGMTKPDKAAIFLGKVIVTCLLILAALQVYLTSRGY